MEGNSVCRDQPTYIVSVDGDDFVLALAAYEFFYQFQVTDNITVTCRPT